MNCSLLKLQSKSYKKQHELLLFAVMIGAIDFALPEIQTQLLSFGITEAVVSICSAVKCCTEYQQLFHTAKLLL